MVDIPSINGALPDLDVLFRAVPVYELRAIWPSLQEGLEQVRASNGEPWIAEDVYSSLLYSKSKLYVIENYDEELLGFVIFEPLYFPYDFEQRLNIWIGWSKHKGHGHIGVEVAKRVAKAAGIRSVVFCTPQENGWVQKFRKLHTWYEVD